MLHSKKKSTSEHPFFWCFRLSQILDSIQYLEGPNSTWKDHNRNLGVHLDLNIPIIVLSGTIWSFQVLNRVQYLRQPKAPKKKGALKYFLFLEWTSYTSFYPLTIISTRTKEECHKEHVFIFP